mgnify:CR=1 FL=1
MTLYNTPIYSSIYKESLFANTSSFDFPQRDLVSTIHKIDNNSLFGSFQDKSVSGDMHKLIRREGMIDPDEEISDASPTFDSLIPGIKEYERESYQTFYLFKSRNSIPRTAKFVGKIIYEDLFHYITTAWSNNLSYENLIRLTIYDYLIRFSIHKEYNHWLIDQLKDIYLIHDEQSFLVSIYGNVL